MIFPNNPMLAADSSGGLFDVSAASIKDMTSVRALGASNHTTYCDAVKLKNEDTTTYPGVTDIRCTIIARSVCLPCGVLGMTQPQKWRHAEDGPVLLTGSL